MTSVPSRAKLGTRYRNTISPQQLVGQFTERAACLLQIPFSTRSRGVQASPPTLDDRRARTEEAFVLHAVECGVQGAGTDLMTVSSELFHDPGPVDFALGSMVEHVQLNSTAVDRAHGRRLRATRRAARRW